VGTKAFTKKEKEGLSDFRNRVKNSNSRMKMSVMHLVLCSPFYLSSMFHIPGSLLLQCRFWVSLILVGMRGFIEKIGLKMVSTSGVAENIRIPIFFRRK